MYVPAPSVLHSSTSISPGKPPSGTALVAFHVAFNGVLDNSLCSYVDLQFAMDLEKLKMNLLRNGQPSAASAAAVALWLTLSGTVALADSTVPPPVTTDPAVEMMKPCAEGNGDPELQAIACTELITGGHLLGAQLSAAYVFRGKANAARRQLQAAIADFTSALKIDGRAADALYNRGAAHALVGRVDLALQDFDKVLELAPGDPDTLFYRARIYAQQGRNDAAIKDLTAVLKTVPNDPDSLDARGELYIVTGAFDAAILDQTALIAAMPNSAEAFYNRGRARFLKEDFAAAAQDFEMARSKRDNNPYAALRLYLSNARLGKATAKPDTKPLEAAMLKYDLGAWPMPIAALTLGKISEQDFQQLLQVKDPAAATMRSCETHYYLGEFALAKGDKAAALGHFRAVDAKGASLSIECTDAVVELKRLGG
jgi:lipoprotein NlpI